MNKIWISILILFSIALCTISCNQKPAAEEADQQTSTEEEWEAMDNFHLIMAECYHPFKDSGNLEPAKHYAGELKQSAQAWSEAPLPTIVDNDDVKGMLSKLREGSEAFSTVVEGGDDAAITSALEEIHDEFHHIQEAWYTAKSKVRAK